jgi:hypothetical protein
LDFLLQSIQRNDGIMAKVWLKNLQKVSWRLSASEKQLVLARLPRIIVGMEDVWKTRLSALIEESWDVSSDPIIQRIVELAWANPLGEKLTDDDQLLVSLSAEIQDPSTSPRDRGNSCIKIIRMMVYGNGVSTPENIMPQIEYLSQCLWSGMATLDADKKKRFQGVLEVLNREANRAQLDEAQRAILDRARAQLWN